VEKNFWPTTTSLVVVVVVAVDEIRDKNSCFGMKTIRDEITGLFKMAIATKTIHG